MIYQAQIIKALQKTLFWVQILINYGSTNQYLIITI